MMEPFHVAVIGSGFAGTLLARILHRQGLRVVLLERYRHPRFAVGESSTPLAAIGLERLAERYGFEDLQWLAAYGRWMRNIPDIRRGLKRGFTFFRHHPGQAFVDTPEHAGRLLVAASPDDAVADSHWLREDVDAFLVRQASSEGVDFRDQVRIASLRRAASGGWDLEGLQGDGRFTLHAEVVIDGSGTGGVLANTLPVASYLDRIGLDTGLVYGHLKGVKPFVELAPGPYPDEKAAVHHLLDEGWMYVLPFDHGVVSAGILLRREAMECLAESGVRDPEAVWQTVIGRYPSLRDPFERAVPVQPLRVVSRVQRRLACAAGPDWAMLPNTFAFLDPMFSTGIAWSVRGVERLALILGAAAGNTGMDPSTIASGFERYAHMLDAEVQQMAHLLDGAYLAMYDFDLFTAQSFLYFAIVSYQEIEERLFPAGRHQTPPAWCGFLGAGVPELETLFAESRRRLETLLGHGDRVTTAAERQGFVEWVTDAIRERNLAGLADPARRNLYPVDLDLLVVRAGLFGMTNTEMQSKLYLLRGNR